MNGENIGMSAIIFKSKNFVLFTETSARDAIVSIILCIESYFEIF